MHAFRVLLAALLLAFGARAGRVTVTLLATTDLHGNLYPVDYFTGRPAPRGLARIASLIDAVRRETPNTILIDCGDTIEGTPLESVWQQYVSTGRVPLGLAFPGKPPEHDPMMLAMNRLGYRAMVLGNHEFNFGLKSVNAARKDAKFPWISANTITDSNWPFAPYVVETVAGLKIAIIGITTTAIPGWEQPEHYQGYRFVDGGTAAAAAVADLHTRERPAAIVAGVHAGLSRNPNDSENIVRQVASVPGVDAVVYGHSHQQNPGERLGDVLVVQPKNWGMSLARLDLTFEDGKLIDKRSALIPVAEDTPADPEILALAKPYHELTERYLNTPIAESPADMDGRFGRIEDTPLVDAIHAVQLHYATADVSFASLFNPRVQVPKGPVTVRQIAALYVYDNELYAIEGDGRMVKDALENAARYFLPCPDPACSHGPLINRRVIGYNADSAQGVQYEIDLNRPEGQRILNLRRNGRPLAPGDKLRIAVNNYRAGGSAGYEMFRNAKVLWKSSRDIRNLIIEYFTERKLLPARADNNWRVIPPAAGPELRKEAAEEAEQQGNR